jgi:SAM-dependent methyltransferase
MTDDIQINKIKEEEAEYFDDNLLRYLEVYYISSRWSEYRKYISSLIFRRFNQVKNLKILDIGCGPLPSLPAVFTTYPDYIGIDISKKCILHFHKEAKCDAVVGDCENIPFRDNSFDLIISFGALHHLPDPFTTVLEIERVLKSGGLFIAHEPSSYWTGKMESPHERGFSLTEINLLFNSFLKLEILTFNHPFLEKHFQKIKRIFGDKAWKIIFSLEHLLSKIRIYGTDYIILAE